MAKSNKPITIREFEGFSEKQEFGNYKHLPSKTFAALESFILANNNDKTNAVELMSLSARKNVGKVITAKNYVGLITLKDGTVIEILPKIAGNNNDKEVKAVFIKMLKTLDDTPFKEFIVSNLEIEKLSLFEIFIKMFLSEANALNKQGLKSAYIEVEENERFYKGKLAVSQNIRYNIANKERFFVRYDEFSVNRPENRLIKSTLRFLLDRTQNQNSQSEIIKLLTDFERVDYSADYAADFSKVLLDRTMKRYQNLMNWCRVFLQGNSFTSFAGSETAIALLFPMEKVFESYIANLFKKFLSVVYALSIQDNKYSLFDQPNKAFRLKPDIVITGKITPLSPIVLDTKWKLLSSSERNYGISQADMYQMYAYGKKYDADKIVLLYPKTDEDIIIRPFVSNDGVTVEVKFIDLFNAEADIKAFIGLV